jgi:8-oxo-dGTP pyrophosphatase MutT (NUDIX family)
VTMIDTHSLHDYVSPSSEIIEEAHVGRIFILVDDEDRENEGDLVIPAQFATTEAINFMARHARGLIILFDEIKAVLLIRFAVVRASKPFVFWATPGGGIEDAETELGAARRELAEELHLDIELTGPVHTISSTFEHEGVITANTDVFFVGQCNRDAPHLDAFTEDERKAMQEIRWWSTAEIEQTTELVFPPDLGSVIRTISATLSVT